MEKRGGIRNVLLSTENDQVVELHDSFTNDPIVLTLYKSGINIV